SSSASSAGVKACAHTAEKVEGSRMPKNRESLDTNHRWTILQRDDFACAFCGARPGNERLQVDHIIPVSRGGSDENENLVTSCDRCNNGKSNRIAVPKKMCTGELDRNGWIIWKRWGLWVIHWNELDLGERAEPGMNAIDPDTLVDASCDIALTCDPDGRDYWIAIDRVHENDWRDHLEGKPWFSSELGADFDQAIHFARRLMRRRKR
ncbi:MAG: HNH endonuclease, partial [Proteobacteria bacterium]|nr:HNH endonuclease [Pseudomonadota bacterium]